MSVCLCPACVCHGTWQSHPSAYPVVVYILFEKDEGDIVDSGVRVLLSVPDGGVVHSLGYEVGWIP